MQLLSLKARNLQMFQFIHNTSYTMPVNFGEDDLLGSMGKDAHVMHQDITSIFLSYTTDRKQLQ